MTHGYCDRQHQVLYIVPGKYGCNFPSRLKKNDLRRALVVLSSLIIATTTPLLANEEFKVRRLTSESEVRYFWALDSRWDRGHSILQKERFGALFFGDGPRRPKPAPDAPRTVIASLAEIADLYASRRTEISLWSKAKAWPQPYIPGTYVKCSLIIVCKLSYLPTSRPLLISRISASILRPIRPSSSLILVCPSDTMMSVTLMLRIFTFLSLLTVALSHKSKLGPSASKGWGKPTPTPTPTPKVLCATAPVQCCASVVNTTQTEAISALNSLNISVPTTVIDIGLSCSNVTDAEVEDGFW